MNILQAILYIYSNLEFDKDFIVTDNHDGKGPILTWLSKTIKQPTQAELDTAWIQVQALEKVKQIKIQKKIDIEKVATLSDQLNLIAGVLNTITSPVPDQAIIDNAKLKFKQIQSILLK